MISLGRGLTLRNGCGAESGLEGGGGAVYHLGGTVEAVECTFLDNAAEKSGPDVGGGAVYGDGVGDTVAVNSVFSGNEASNGGAIGALYNGVTIVNVRFLGNQATGSGGTQGGNGGAVYMDGENKPLAVSGAVFTGNAAGNLGSAIFRTAYHTEATTIGTAHPGRRSTSWARHSP